MSKVSKVVADRMLISATVMSSLAVHGPEIAPVLEKLLFPAGAPAHLTVAGFLQALHDLLDRDRGDLAAKDLAHTAELSDDAVPRAHRDEKVTALRATLVSVRATFSNNFDADVVTAYGLPSAVPEGTEVLLRTAELVEDRLRTRPLAEAPRTVGVTVSPLVLADDLQGKIGAVRGALGEVERERREAQLTLQGKNESLGTSSMRYQGVADITTGIYEVCDRQNLADVVRPTARRRAGVPEPTDEAPAGTGEGGPAGGATG